MEQAIYQPPWRVRLGRSLLRPIFRSIYRAISHVSITGLEHVPRQGAYLIAFNHVSLYDGPFVLSFWPVAPEVAGAVDIWQRQGQSLLVRVYGGIPVRRGEYDRQLLERLVLLLQAGQPLVIAPEGGRSHVPGLRKALPGVAYLIERTGLPVVPVGIVGATSDYFRSAMARKRPHIEMRIGPLLQFPTAPGSGHERRLQRQLNADRVMYAIADLLPVEYRGVYAG